MTKLPCRYRATASLCILLFCIACLFIIDGCSKTGQFEKQPAELPSSASTFFTVSSSVDPTVAAIAASLHQTAMENCSNCTWQYASESGLLSITANNNAVSSGVRVFRSSRNNINFTPLTH